MAAPTQPAARSRTDEWETARASPRAAPAYIPGRFRVRPENEQQLVVDADGVVNVTFSKVAEASRRVILVDVRNTSKMCSRCGELVTKTLSERTYSCPSYGLVMDRDRNVAINILQRDLQTFSI